MSAEHGIRFLPSVAALVLQGLGQHRLLSTRQVQVLHLPAVSLRYTQRVLAELQRAGLADRAIAAHGKALWFPTAEGRLLLRSRSRLESRGDHGSPWQTDSVLREHTLALNDTGIAFVKAARARGDECDAFSWRHEIAHPGLHQRQPARAISGLARQYGDRSFGDWLAASHLGTITHRARLQRDMVNAIQAPFSTRPRLTREDVLDGREVADLLDLPVSTVLEYARRGLLPGHKLGRRWIFLRDEVEAAVRGKAHLG